MESFDIGVMKTPPAGLKFYRRENEYEVFARTISLLVVFYAVLATSAIVVSFAYDFIQIGFVTILIALYVFSSLFWKLFGWARLVVKDDCFYYTTFVDRLYKNPPIVVALEDLKNIRMTTEYSRRQRWGQPVGKNVIELKMLHEKVLITFDSSQNAWVSIFLKRVHTAYRERKVSSQVSGERDQ